MILTCPNCATDFLIPDHLIGPEGREVKCDECGEVWIGGVKTVAPEPEPVAATAKSPSVAAVPEPAVPNVMFAPRKAASAPKRGRGRTTPAAVAPKSARGRTAMIFVLLVLSLIGAGFLAFHGAEVKAWLASTGVYRAIGISRAPPTPPSHG